MDFVAEEDFKETKAVEVEEEAQPVRLMFTEGEEEEDDELLQEIQEVKQADQCGMYGSLETKRSLIN